MVGCLFHKGNCPWVEVKITAFLPEGPFSEHGHYCEITRDSKAFDISAYDTFSVSLKTPFFPIN